VLRDAGLDERAWLKLEEHWTARLAADGALVDRYVARYAAVTAPPAPLRIEGTLAPDDWASLRAALPFLDGAPRADIITPGPARPRPDPGRPDATLELGASLPLPAWIDSSVGPKKPA
jgi:hypothetical protein